MLVLEDELDRFPHRAAATGSVRGVTREPTDFGIGVRNRDPQTGGLQ